ncbi:unnamed protein product [Calypogeia fissa]
MLLAEEDDKRNLASFSLQVGHRYTYPVNLGDPEVVVVPSNLSLTEPLAWKLQEHLDHNCMSQSWEDLMVAQLVEWKHREESKLEALLVLKVGDTLWFSSARLSVLTLSIRSSENL